MIALNFYTNMTSLLNLSLAIKCIIKKCRCSIRIGLFSLIMMTSGTSFSQSNDIFYLQVGSFKTESNALNLEKRLSELSEKVVIRGEIVKDMGRWYRVYIGPFQEKKKALAKGDQLREKGIFKGRSIVRRKSDFLKNNLDQKHVEKTASTSAQHFSGTADPILPEQLKPAPMPEILILPTSPPPAALPLPSPPDTSEKKSVPGHALAATGAAGLQIAESETWLGKDEEPPLENGKVPEVTVGDQTEEVLSQREKSPEETEVSPQRYHEDTSIPDPVVGAIPHGRNLSGGTFSIALEHTWSKVQTNLIHRTRVLSDGETTVKENVSPDATEKDDISTYMILDTIQFRYGLWDFMEVRAEAGLVYADFSNTNLSYGGGLRIKLLDRSYNHFFNYFMAIQGDYQVGALEDEYVSDAGEPWQKKTDWQAFNTCIEFGVVFPSATIYAGATYFIYNEETERNLIGKLPSPLVSFKYEDELVEENRLGVMGGVMLHITPNFHLNLETYLLNRSSITLAVEYRF